MPSQINKSVLNKILIARRMHGIALENINSQSEIALGIGVNLLQDAVEIFLLAVSEHLHASVPNNTRFDKYFDIINEKIAPATLPFQSRLLQLNKLRVNSKHFGLTPARSEVEDLSVVVREFFEEVTSRTLARSFSTISLIDLLREGEDKECLKAAEVAFINGNFEKCLVECRKALFIRFESQYDISYFKKSEDKAGLMSGLIGAMIKAPLYAKDNRYIEEAVKDPVDYVVFDHDKLNMELIKEGIDTTLFWNVWRLTPGVYRKQEGEWVVRREFVKLDVNGIQDRAEYCLEATINILITVDQRLAATKYISPEVFFVSLKKEQVPVYEKASASSRIVGTTPSELNRVYVDYLVQGLDDSSYYYKLSFTQDYDYIPVLISHDVVDE